MRNVVPVRIVVKDRIDVVRVKFRHLTIKNETPSIHFFVLTENKNSIPDWEQIVTQPVDFSHARAIFCVGTIMIAPCDKSIRYEEVAKQY